MIRKSYSCLDFVNGNRLHGTRASALQGALFELFVAEAHGTRPPPASARRALDAELSRCFRRPALARQDGRYELIWGADSAIEDVARSAVALLTSEDLARLRVCAADECNWLFLDESRNSSRRWCDMKVCGNRAKARKFYARWS